MELFVTIATSGPVGVHSSIIFIGRHISLRIGCHLRQNEGILKVIRGISAHTTRKSCDQPQPKHPNPVTMKGIMGLAKLLHWLRRESIKAWQTYQVGMPC
jgi:hypothetical protein